MSEKIRRYGKILISVIFVLTLLMLVGWGISWGYSYLITPVTIQQAVVSASLATDGDEDGLDDTWEAANGFNTSVDNTGDAWTYNVYDDTTGALWKTQTFIVDSTSSSKINNTDPEVAGLRLVSEVQYAYDQAGRTWRTRQVENLDDGNGCSQTSPANDKITLTVYNNDGSVFKTVDKGVGNTGEAGIEDGDVITENYYDDHGRISYTIDAEDYITYYTYTALGQQEKVYRDYDSSIDTTETGVTTTTFGTGHPLDGKTLLLISTTEYDDAGRVSKSLDAKGNYRTMDYDSFGQVIKTIAWDEEGQTDTAMLQSRRKYDYLGRVITDVVMANPASTSNEISITDKVTDYVYFAGDEDHPGLLYQANTYNNNSGTALVSEYDYDEMGRQIKIIDPDNNENHIAYNNAGRVQFRWTKEINTTLSQTVYTLTKYHYNHYGQVREQRQMPIDPTNPGLPSTYPPESATNDLITLYTYNGLGQLEEMTDPEGTVTEYGYNWLGQRSWMIAGSGDIEQQTDFGYNRLGQQSSISGYADGTTEQETQYAYNLLGQVETITYPDDETIVYVYNPMGQVETRTDQRSIVTEYEYDVSGNLLTKAVEDFDYDFDSSADDDIEETFTYDVLNRMLTAVKTVYYNGGQTGDHISTSTLSNYTSLGAAKNINDKYYTDQYGQSSSYDYDQAGNVTEITYPDSSVITRTVDSHGRIATIAQSSTILVSYEYIGSRVGGRFYDATDVTYPVTYLIEYDDFGRAERHYTYKYSTNIVDFGYTYDKNSNITGISFDHRPLDGNNDPVYNDYTYDVLNRLTGADYLVNDYSSTNQGTESFTMDDLGNRTSATLRGETSKTYARNELTNRYDETGTFDVSCGYDNAGSTIVDQNGYQYSYDYENRIIRIRDSQSTLVAEFEYDALGRRIMKDEPVTYGTRFYYYNAAWQVLVEDDGTSTTNQYVYGNYIDETLLMDDGVDEYYYVHNHLFSTVALLDDSGDIVERYEYNAYGLVQVSADSDLDSEWFDGSGGWDSGDTIYTSSQYGNPYTFTGRQLDTLDNGNLKIMYYRARTYDPHIGRMIQQDPLGSDPASNENNPFQPINQYKDGANVYEYVKSCPMISLDPYGLSGCSTGCEFGIPPAEVKTRSQGGYMGMVTLSKWIFETRTVPCGNNQLKIEKDNCQAGITWWYVDPQIYSGTDKFGRNTRDHEWEHVMQRQMAWEGLLAEAGQYIENCFCTNKSKCYNDALWNLQFAYLNFGDMIANGYDCEAYTDGVDPAIKQRACDRSKNAENLFYTSWNMYKDSMEFCDKIY